MTTVDYIVVGSGLTGSTVARLLTDRGGEVLVLERRTHSGGNVHDFEHASGIRVHAYGPHYFRCCRQETWEFVNRFSPFYNYRPIIRTHLNGQYIKWPLTRAFLDSFAAPARVKFRPKAKNFEEACLRMFPPEIYEQFIEGYTRRQWGITPDLLDAKLADRLRINEDHEDTLMPQMIHQGLPTFGYAGLMTRMLSGIPYSTGIDYLKHRGEYHARKALIFTGPIDEYFEFKLGRLTYRAQQRQIVFVDSDDWCQPCIQVNHPRAGADQAIRTIEWKYLMPLTQRERVHGTVITHEYPFTPENPNDYEYPVPIASNRSLYARYRRLADDIPKLIVCGRLGECRYLDMNQAIERAMAVTSHLLGA